MHVYLSPHRASSRVLVAIFLSCASIYLVLRVNLPGLTHPNLAGLLIGDSALPNVTFSSTLNLRLDVNSKLNSGSDLMETTLSPSTPVNVWPANLRAGPLGLLSWQSHRPPTYWNVRKKLLMTSSHVVVTMSAYRYSTDCGNRLCLLFILNWLVTSELSRRLSQVSLEPSLDLSCRLS